MEASHLFLLGLCVGGYCFVADKLCCRGYRGFVIATSWIPTLWFQPRAPKLIASLQPHLQASLPSVSILHTFASCKHSFASYYQYYFSVLITLLMYWSYSHYLIVIVSISQWISNVIHNFFIFWKYTIWEMV